MDLPKEQEFFLPANMLCLQSKQIFNITSKYKQVFNVCCVLSTGTDWGTSK